MFSFVVRLPCSCCHCWTELISLLHDLISGLQGRKAGANAQKVMALLGLLCSASQGLVSVPRYQMDFPGCINPFSWMYKLPVDSQSWLWVQQLTWKCVGCCSFGVGRSVHLFEMDFKNEFSAPVSLWVQVNVDKCHFSVWSD